MKKINIPWPQYSNTPNALAHPPEWLNDALQDKMIPHEIENLYRIMTLLRAKRML